MPGSKRKLDEDTWLIFQSKKSKTNQLSQSIYECTLAKLRHGTRSFFNPQAVPSSSWNNSTPGFSPTADALSSVNSGSRNALLAQHSVGTTVCTECQLTGLDMTKATKCSFCDKRACHLNPCKSCGEDFCYNCYIRRYDNPSVDTYLCIGCLP